MSIVSTQYMTRRRFLAIGGLAAGAAATRSCDSVFAEQEANKTASFGFRRYSDLLKTLKQRGHKPRVLGYAPDRSPVVAVKAGGNKKPAIFISAGSHSTEHAGVVAAVDLIDELETEHQVYVLPCRDPMGLSGYHHVLSLGLGSEPAVRSVEEVESLLRKNGEVLYDSDGRLLVLIGEYGYANRSFYRKIEKGAPFLEPLKGRRMYSHRITPTRREQRHWSGLIRKLLHPMAKFCT